MEIRIAGRYFRESVARLITGIHKAGKKSNIKTEAERHIGYVSYSIDNDFHDKFRPRQHHKDAHSIASEHRKNLLPVAELEREKQEAEYLREAVEVASTFIREAEARLLELGTSEGSLIFLERQAEIRNAQENGKRKRMKAV